MYPVHNEEASIHPVPFVTQPFKYAAHSMSEVAVMLSPQVLTLHLLVAVLAASPEQYSYVGFLLASRPVYFLNASHYYLVPLYEVHGSVLGMHPTPLVTQPLK